MESLKLFFLGIVQGLTEFLPVSSSGHLFLAETFLNLQQDSLSFAIFIHGATFLSLVTFFLKDTKKISLSKKTSFFVLKLALASLPIAFLGLFFKSSMQEVYSRGLVGLGFLITGLFFVLVLLFSPKKKRGLDSLLFKEALLIGLFQALAALPGFSRSGLTLSTCLLLGFSPRASYFFSFLLALPVLGGAFLLEVFPASFSFSIDWFGAFALAYITGLLSLYFLFFLVQKRRLFIFSFYLIPLGLYLLLF